MNSRMKRRWEIKPVSIGTLPYTGRRSVISADKQWLPTSRYDNPRETSIERSGAALHTPLAAYIDFDFCQRIPRRRDTTGA